MRPYRRSIYLLDPREYSPELIAVAFAKTSRSPESFRDIARELNDDTSARFHEKWVVGYGHASVAEHAVLHLAVENVSRLAVETIESNRLASYTEKSTRYQKWESDRYYTPVEILGSSFESLYADTCRALFQAYETIQAPTREYAARLHPRRSDETEEQWDRRIRSRYIDSCRFLLPAASLANVGITINARMLEHAISKMLSSPLDEVRSIGEEIRDAALEEVPTLLKYTDASDYLQDIRVRMEEVPVPADPLPDQMVRLLSADPRDAQRVLAAALFEHSTLSYGNVLNYVDSLDIAAQAELAGILLGKRSRYEAPPRVLEHACYMFELVMDQGAYFEIKRHRIMTQTPQPLTTRIGYAVPKLLEDAGVAEIFRAAMNRAADAVEEISGWNPDLGAYLVPNGFNRRVVVNLNLRELYHLCELRSAANAHYSVRRIALRMAELVQEVHPLLASYLRLPEGESWQSIEQNAFSDTGIE
jgi:thymidylate synthase ThyX